jgi:hypothetical protein
MSERERLLAFLFDRGDKKILNLKFFRGNARDLTVDQLCATALEVVEDTWSREDTLVDQPPDAGAPRILVSTL